MGNEKERGIDELGMLEQCLARYTPTQERSKQGDETHSLPDEEKEILERWLKLAAELCHEKQSDSLTAISPALAAAGHGNGVQPGLVSPEGFAALIVEQARNILHQAYERGALKDSESGHVLFYRVMKDDFSSDAYVSAPKAPGFSTRLYRCLKTLFIKSEPLPDATHVVLDYHLKRRLRPTARANAGQELDDDHRRIQCFARSLLNDFDFGYDTSVLTFNQLDYAVQKLMPEGLIFFGFAQRNGSEDDNPIPDLAKPFALFEYGLERLPRNGAAQIDETKIQYRSYTQGIAASNQRSQPLGAFERKYYSNIFENFLKPDTPSDSRGDCNAPRVQQAEISLRNRVYQLRFESGQIRSQVDAFDPDQITASNSYDYRLSDERLMSILCYGNDPYYFPAVVFFLDLVNSSRTQDQRYTGGYYDGVRFVDRLLCRMTDAILRHGGFVDKSVYDQLFGVIRLPARSQDTSRRKELLEQVEPLFDELAQIMEEERRQVIATGAATADSYGLRIGAALANVRNIVIGHPLAGIDFTVTGQGVILATRLESYLDPATRELKLDEQPVFSIRLDLNLMYAIFEASSGQDFLDGQPTKLSLPRMWQFWRDKGYKRCYDKLPGLGDTEFGISNASSSCESDSVHSACSTPTEG